MKKILAILIALLAALSAQTVAFADGEVTEMEPTTTVSEDDETTKTLDTQTKDDQGLTYTLNNDGTATVFSCNRTVTSIKIPSNVESNGQTYTVTSIGDYAFASCYITSVDIPDGVTSIGNGAFSMCSGLTSVDIPDSVTSIGNSAFLKCSGLTSVTIPGSVTSIGSYAFEDCSYLTKITFEGTVPNLAYGPFYNCRAVQTVYLSDDLTAEERAEWEEVLKIVIPEGYQIVYTDLTLSLIHI